MPPLFAVEIETRRLAQQYRERWKLGLGLGILVLNLTFIVVVALMVTPTLPYDTPDAARIKTILNAGGLGILYWEGASCLVDLYGIFEPLGTYDDKLVGRYTQRTSWWNWLQCPTGTLVELDAETSPAWREAVMQRQQEEAIRAAARAHQLRILTEQAQQR